MNSQSMTANKLNAFVTTFDESDREIMQRLADIYVETLPSADGALVASDELNLDLLMSVLNIDKSNRRRTATTIMKYIDSDSILEYTAGTRTRATQLSFKSFDAFIHGCMFLRNDRAMLVQRFAAKCTAILVELYVHQNQQHQQELERISTESAANHGNYIKCADRHAWTRILRLRNIASGSFKRTSPRASRMKALGRQLVRVNAVEWRRGKPYFVSEASITANRDLIMGWRL